MKFKITGAIELDAIEDGAPRIVFSVTTQNNVTIKDINMLILPADQKVHCSIEPVDAKGNPAKVDGVPTWSSSNDQIATVTPEPDTGSGVFTAWVTPTAQIGICQINVSADADLGSGVTPINGVLDLEVVSGQAVGFEIAHDAPVPQKA